MTSARATRLSSAMQAELSGLVARDVKDPRLHAAGLVTITEVRLTPDLRQATVWVSFVGATDAAMQSAMAALERATGFLRGEIGRRLSLKRAPELRFVRDRTGEHAQHIDELLRDGGGGREGGGGEPA